MKMYSFCGNRLLRGFALSLIGLSLAAWCVVVKGQRDVDQMPLMDALNSDGTLRAGLSGGFDVSGYRMEHTATGTPRFTPMTGCGSPGRGWDAQFTLPDGTDGNVYALAVNGNDIYVGGKFVTAGQAVANNVAKFNTVTATWSKLGSAEGSGVDGEVRALMVSGGDLYVGGLFTLANVGGATVTATNIARFSLTTQTWASLGSGAGNGLNDRVNALALSGNRLYVGGNFTAANTGGATITANFIASFDLASNIWNALGSGGGNGVNSPVFALLPKENLLYAGGDFTVANTGGGTVEALGVAKFDMAASSWSALGSGGGHGVSGFVRAMTMIGNGLYVGGFFYTANYGGTELLARSVAKFDTTTGVWSALGSGGGNGVEDTVFAMTAIGDTLYVGGWLYTANAGGTPVTTHHLAKFNTLTNSWSKLGTGSGNGVDEYVHALAAINNDLYTGGSFTRANIGGTIVAANHVVKFNAATNAWNALTFGGGNGANETVRALLVAGNTVYIGGDFTKAGNIAANHIASFDMTTNTWSALGSGGGNGVDAPVFALAIIGNHLFVGGRFKAANPGGALVATNRLAKFSLETNTWSAVGSGGGRGVNGDVNALAAKGSALYVGGFFGHANFGGPLIEADSVVKFDTATNTWSALSSSSGNGVNSTVQALAITENDVYVGGSFTRANDGTAFIAANRVAKFNLTTNTWSALGSGGGNGVDGDVRTLAVLGNNLYVGGDFTNANSDGTLVPANRIAKLDLTNKTWSKVGVGNGNGADGNVFVMTAMGGDLYIGGLFKNLNAGDGTASIPANGLAKWDGNHWSTIGVEMGNGVNGWLNTLAFSNDDLYAGGRFSMANVSGLNNGVASSNIARIGAPASTVTAISSSPNVSIAGQPATFTATISQNGVGINKGCVTFREGSVVLAANVAVNQHGQSSFSISSLGAGDHVVTAEYSGAAGFSASSGSVRQTVNTPLRLGGGIDDPIVCLGTGGHLAVEATITNTGLVAIAASFTATLPPTLLALPGTCVASTGNCAVMNASIVAWEGILSAGQMVAIGYKAQTADNVLAGTLSCVTSSAMVSGIPAGSVTACTTPNCPTAGPGSLPQTASPLSDGKAGSVLIYNVYTSSTNPNQQNTRLNLTNTNPALPANVHLFFVDGASCSVADSFICLTPNQTTSFLASDFDPGTTGYVVAVAVDENGCPINFNHLIGDEFVKFASGHAANLGAEAIAAIAGGLPACDANSSTAMLNFDGVSYNVLPHVLAADNLPSRADGNDTLLILNRIGGNLGIGAATLGPLFGLFYNDTETSLSFSFTTGTCQFRSSISNNFPRIAPRFEQFVPAGRSGWFKVWLLDLAAMTGAVINFNANATANAGAFNQGHNLHVLTNTSTANYVVPVFPPSC